jgi:hypothetical protein
MGIPETDKGISISSDPAGEKGSALNLAAARSAGSMNWIIR